MGLFKYLKNKFSKKDKVENKESETLSKYDQGLEKSRKTFADQLSNLSKKYKKINEEYFSDLEEILIEADVGVNLSLKVIKELMDVAKQNKIDEVNDLNEALIDLLFEKYMKDDKVLEKELKFEEGKTTVCLIVGVNGVGKTTSIAKLANRYKNMGKNVALVAADTFRAGAKEQLSIWANRIGIDIFTGKDSQDPASLVYEALNASKNKKYDLVIVDTAGRLQNKVNLMNELSKINKVIDKALSDSIKESLLIIDATTGQNGVKQASSFYDVTSLTGIIITKMDGTSKGGIILSIRDELGLPVRFIGLGEKLDDLEEFDLEKYLYSLCVGK